MYETSGGHEHFGQGVLDAMHEEGIGYNERELREQVNALTLARMSIASADQEYIDKQNNKED